MTDTDRLTQLEVQHIALTYVLRALMPLLTGTRAEMLALHTVARDALSAHMATAHDNTGFQQAALTSFDALWEMMAPDD